MNRSALTIFLILLSCAPSVACLSSTLGELPPQKMDWETLKAITAPVLRARPAANWPARVWGRVAGRLSQSEIDGITAYLTAFEGDPAKAKSVFQRRFNKVPEHRRYVLNVEDNVISCYLLLWERGIQENNPMYLDFALARLRALRNVSSLFYENGRVVSQIGHWALQQGAHRYAEFVEVVRNSPWAVVEFDPVFPRPHSLAQD